jgi:hypothetical protein
MQQHPESQDVQKENTKEYQTPEIIYEGVISTRAGTVTDPGGPGGNTAPADPVDLFG